MSDEDIYKNGCWGKPVPDIEYPCHYKIGRVDVHVNELIPQEEAVAYVKRVNKYFNGLRRLYVVVDGEHVDLYEVFTEQEFERIRRITGYLVGNLDRFNDGKRAEERERVKHRVGTCKDGC